LAIVGASRAKQMEKQRFRWTAADLQAEFYDLVFRYFSRRVQPREEAEDLTAATFLAAFGQLHRFQSSEPQLLLFGIARRKLADSLRRRKGHTSLETAHSTQAPDPEIDHGLVHELYKAVEHLPPQWREPLQLRYLEGLSVKQIAAVLGKPEKAVKANLQRARQKLRENPELKAYVEGEE
jgi:RNA polymerase sigma-70 factor, ECF subfamily